MNITPKIDYALLGEAVSFYAALGYTYREVPWVVPEDAIKATLPDECSRFALHAIHPARVHGENFMFAGYPVGSAEQSLITMNLPAGMHFAVTPCFRVEAVTDIFYQPHFMKVELFDNRPAICSFDPMIEEARRFAKVHGVRAEPVETDIGWDLMVDGVEIGSYGFRNHKKYGRWAYGTGLALPRFSVAKALQSIT